MQKNWALAWKTSLTKCADSKAYPQQLYPRETPGQFTSNIPLWQISKP
jgi:hypothetical protein